MPEYRVICKEEPHSAITEQYRKLRTSIDFSSFNKELKVINLTSTFPEEGKTVTCLNLATVYSQSKQKTLLIDLDLRKPKIHRAFNVLNIAGASDFITGDYNIEQNILHIDEYLDVIVAGTKLPFPSELLASKKIINMINDLRNKYDKIIIDCPPLSAVADATIISNFCDGTIYVVASRKSNSSVVLNILDQLRDSGANIIGGVLTKVNKRDSYYGMNYYYYYGDK